MDRVARFLESMTMTHERWHDGTGYDLALLGEATAGEQAQIEGILTARGVHDWRDAEALAALDTPRARETVQRAFRAGSPEMRALLIAHAPGLFGEDERTDALVRGLEDEAAASQLTQVLLEVEEHHPPPVIQALLRGVRSRDGITAGEFAMMLLYLHGKAESPWDFGPRPFILRFQEEPREPLFRELCERIGIPPPPVS